MSNHPHLFSPFRLGPLTLPPDFATLYTPGDKGYLDYPVLAAAEG